jgi:SAM-dependent methyltransferase
VCHSTCIEFGILALTAKEIRGKDIVEVGSLDINGSLRNYLESLAPRKYIGVDLSKGRGVDIICAAECLVARFGSESFDILVSTELMEHVKDWKTVISNFKNVIRKGGIILITTRSKGFEFHEYPFDYWRYEIDDMKNIFSDFKIEIIEKDNLMPGIFLKASKPYDFSENNMLNYKLYSVLTEEKETKINFLDIFWYKIKYKTRPILSKITPKFIKLLIKEKKFGKTN